MKNFKMMTSASPKAVTEEVLKMSHRDSQVIQVAKVNGGAFSAVLFGPWTIKQIYQRRLCLGVRYQAVTLKLIVWC